ncbi:hypothetical protein B0H14DRAFT_2638119 [Mycena olivaceomarginata]|nr:hypothetical protein B0H14DRAFT_2638119 [Mycena olivaceomarginata]
MAYWNSRTMMPFLVPPEAGFAWPSSSHVPTYCHPDYIPSQFLRREAAADFQNRSMIIHQSQARNVIRRNIANLRLKTTRSMLILISLDPPMVDPIRNEPPAQAGAPTVQGRVEYSTVESSVQYHANAAGTSPGCLGVDKGKKMYLG